MTADIGSRPAPPSGPTELVERLEGAEAGSRELDAAIVAHQNNALLKPYPSATDFGPVAKWQFWSLDGQHFLGNESRFPVAPVTTSLDAALALAERVLPGQEYEITTLYGIARVALNLNHGDDGGPFYGENVYCSVPLALCAAILKATAASAVGTTVGREPKSPTTREGADR